ncbi:MAG: hypothetical protein R2720_10580 [Candidatus Nanopelagicales bacterium]
MAFIQIIEFQTSRIDEMNALIDQWLADTEGVRTSTRNIQAQDRDHPDSYIQIVEFPSYEEAMANSDRSETGQFAARMTALCDGPLTYRNFDVTRSVLA